MKVTNGINVFGAAIFIPVLILGVLELFAEGGRPIEVPNLHLVTELTVFFAGIFFWYYAVRGFKIVGSFRMLVVAFGLLFAALLFFGHGLFETQVADGGLLFERAEWYKRLAALALALVLLIAVGFGEREVALRERRRTLAAMAVLFTVGIVVAIIVIESALASDVSVAATLARWTPLGRFLHVATIMFFTVGAIRYLYGAFLIRSEVALAFATGTVLFLMGEISYALSQARYDPYFWLSHLWFAMGYLGFVWGGYAARVTHHESQLVSPS